MEQAKIKAPTNTQTMVTNSKKMATPAAKKASGTVMDYLKGDAFKKSLAEALPSNFETDRFVRSAISEFRLNPALRECSVPSVLGFYMQAAMCGLEPASILGQCYPVPFNNKKTGKKECQFIIGYRGMAAIARRSGEVVSIDAQIVHEKDDFELCYGIEQKLSHKPYIDGDPGAMRGAYCIVRFRDGSYQFRFMPTMEIDSHRRRSKASSSGPWVTDYEEMAKKTVFRSVFKWLPVTIEAATAVEGRDGTVANYRSDADPTTMNPEDMVEVEFVAASDEPTSETNEAQVDEKGGEN